ncbi:MAG UNVERIFIED_CONTAM: hypothetical protein LVQ98_07755 [Rickettsiaceae bacterium]|jgi:hypothetical protein
MKEKDLPNTPKSSPRKKWDKSQAKFVIPKGVSLSTIEEAYERKKWDKSQAQFTIPKGGSLPTIQEESERKKWRDSIIENPPLELKKLDDPDTKRKTESSHSSPKKRYSDPEDPKALSPKWVRSITSNI